MNNQSLNIPKYKLVGTAITDLEGKYGYPLEANGDYIIEVLASDYTSTKSQEFSSNNEVVKDIFLERNNAKGSNLSKSLFLLRNNSFKIINFVVFIIYSIGFFYSLLSTYNEFTGLNLVITIVYLLLLSLNIYSFLKNLVQKKSSILDQNQNPIAGVSVRIYDNEDQLAVFLSNKRGKVKMNLESGKYIARFALNQGDFRIENNTQDVEIGKDGKFTKNIILNIVNLFT